MINKEPIIDKCEGCNRIEEINGTNFCSAYLRPYYKWRLGICPLCSTIRKVEYTKQEKQRVGQQKQHKKKK